MSVRLMSAVFEIEIAPLDKLLLLAMADHARDDGTGCYPSVSSLARKASLSDRGVQKILRRLEEAGLIVPTAHGKGGRGLTTEYQITPQKGEPGSLFPSGKGRTAEQKRVNRSAEKGERGSPESLRSVKNHKAAALPATSKPEDSVWDFLKIQPCGPISFRVLLESRWSSRNGGLRSLLIGETVDAWEVAEREKLRRAPQLFRALAELRRKEKQESPSPTEASEPIHTLTAEEIPA